MIKLLEIIHTIRNDKEKNLTEIDDWKITDVDYLTDMGFVADGMYHFHLKKPDLVVSHKNGKGFILKDVIKKEKKLFTKFDNLVKYFESYEQKWENAPYKIKEKDDPYDYSD